MKVLIQLALNSIRKYKRESILVISSIALTISLITVVAVIVSSIYATAVSQYEQTNPFNAHVNGVRSVTKYVETIGEERLLYYEVNSSLEDYYIKEDEERVSLSNFYSVGDVKEDSDLLLSNSQLVEGRLPENKYEIVAPRSDDNKIGDVVKIESTNLERSKPYEATIVGLSEYGITYTADFDAYVTERGHDVFLIFNDGQKQIDKTLDTINDSMLVYENSYVTYNTDYNFFKGMQSSPGSTAYMYMLLGIMLVSVVALMTFTLILNAFDTLFTQKDHTFSVLRTVGTTKKQMRMMIMFEGILLAIAGITFGMTIGTLISKYLVNYITNIVDSVVAIEYDVRQALQFRYFFPSKLILGIALLSLFVVILALSIKITKLYKYSAVETSSKLKLKRNKNRTLNNHPVYDMAIINNKTTNNFKGIKIAIMTITTVLVLLNSWLSLVSNTNEFSKGKYSLFLRGDCFSECDTSSDILGVTMALNKIDVVEDVLVYQESNLLWINYEEHTLTNLEVPFNDAYTDGLSLIVMDNSDFETVLDDNEVSKSTKTLFVNKIESFDNETGQQYPESNSLAISDGGVLHVVENSPEGITNKKGIKIDSVIDYLQKDTAFLKNYPSLLIMSTETFNSLNFSFIELNQPRISVSGDFQIEDLKLLNKSMESIEFSTNFHVMSDYANLYISNIVTEAAKFISVVVLSYMGFVIILNIVNITLTNYRNRKKDIAVLRSVGASVKQVQTMLFIESFISVFKSWGLGIIVGTIMSYFNYRLHIKNMILVNIPDFSFSLFAFGATFIFVIMTLIIIRITVSLETSKMNIIEDVKAY